MVGILYKVSQVGSRYAFSTFAAFTMSEFVKLGISASLYAKDRKEQQGLAAAFRETYSSLTPRHVSKIAILSAMYFSNNQLTFFLFLRADPASINLLKAGSSAITAMIWTVFMGRAVSQQQWLAIGLQVCGLVVVQYNPCTQQALLALSAYLWILFSVFLTSFSGVWNEKQIKTMPLSLHEQNMIMYTFGALFNGLGHASMANIDHGFPRFFEGLTFLSFGVIAVNSCFGVVVTAVFKYSNAIVKTLASAVTTVLLTAISFMFFGFPLTIVSAAGCTSTILAVFLYASATD